MSSKKTTVKNLQKKIPKVSKSPDRPSLGNVVRQSIIDDFKGRAADLLADMLNYEDTEPMLDWFESFIKTQVLSKKNQKKNKYKSAKDEFDEDAFDEEEFDDDYNENELEDMELGDKYDDADTSTDEKLAELDKVLKQMGGARLRAGRRAPRPRRTPRRPLPPTPTRRGRSTSYSRPLPPIPSRTRRTSTANRTSRRPLPPVPTTRRTTATRRPLPPRPVRSARATTTRRAPTTRAPARRVSPTAPVRTITRGPARR